MTYWQHGAGELLGWRVPDQSSRACTPASKGSISAHRQQKPYPKVSHNSAINKRGVMLGSRLKCEQEIERDSDRDRDRERSQRDRERSQRETERQRHRESGE